MTDAAIAERMAELAQAGPADRVLVLGAGDGAVARRLARQAHDGMAVGVDPSDDNVRLARRLSAEIENLMFVEGSAEEIPWQEDYFSRVLCLEPLSSRAAQEVFRVTAAEGRVWALVEEAGAAADWLAATGFGPVEIHTFEGGARPVVEAVKPLIR